MATPSRQRKSDAPGRGGRKPKAQAALQAEVADVRRRTCAVSGSVALLLAAALRDAGVHVRHSICAADGADGEQAALAAVTHAPRRGSGWAALRQGWEGGMSVAEIAAELGETPDGVRMKLNRAIARLASAAEAQAPTSRIGDSKPA